MKKMWSVQTGFSLFALIVVCVVLFDHVCGVEPAKRPTPPPAAAGEPDESATAAAASQASEATAAPTGGETLEAAIRASADAFTTAFDRGDAAVVAALWTSDGEYIDDAGRRFSGRAEIERQYAKFFADHPGQKSKSKSIRSGRSAPTRRSKMVMPGCCPVSRVPRRAAPTRSSTRGSMAAG